MILLILYRFATLDARNLINKLLEERVRPPKLVLSIIGDSISFVPKPWLIPVLKTGLIATAKGAKGISDLLYFMSKFKCFI